MKYNILSRALTAMAALLLTACSELSDKDYFNRDSVISSDEVEVVSVSSEEYLASNSNYSSIYNLFKDYEVFSTLSQKGQLCTMLVTDNADYVAPEGDKDDIQSNVNALVSDVAFSPANIKVENTSTRLLMWNGKYISVTATEDAASGKEIYFSTATVKKIIKTTSGYIYVLSSLVNTPVSIYDYITKLDDNYSILRDSVQASGGREFDKANSKAIGVNSEGNTVYDSVFIYKNTHFLEKNVDLSSESLTATLLVASDDVIEEAIADAKARLQQWGLWDEWNRERQYDFEYTMRHWIMDASFFDKKYSAAEMQNTDPENMLTSIFGKYWKTAAQEIDPEPIELSNGVAYTVKKLHIPNHVLVYRLKEFFFIYEYCTAEQKEAYYNMTNMTFKSCNTDVAAWTPLSGVWPLHEDRTLQLSPGEDTTGEWILDFTLCKRIFDNYPTRAEMIKAGTNNNNCANVTEIQKFLVPPGKYDMYFGSKQNQNLTVDFTVYAMKGTTATQVAKSADITLGSSTTYHYDRNPSNHAEGYDSSAENLSSNSKRGNYNTDGGLIISGVEVPDVYGNGDPVEIRLSIHCASWLSQTAMTFTHWCMRPTKDNY